jgi:hypothetical protein
MRIITHGPLDTLDTAATLGEFIDQEHLRHIVPCEASGRSHQHACKGGQRCPVSIDVLVCNMPIRLERHVGVQAAEVLLNRLMLLLTTGRDTHVESDFQGIPPDDAMAQGSCLRSVP